MAAPPLLAGVRPQWHFVFTIARGASHTSQLKRLLWIASEQTDQCGALGQRVVSTGAGGGGAALLEATIPLRRHDGLHGGRRHCTLRRPRRLLGRVGDRGARSLGGLDLGPHRLGRRGLGRRLGWRLGLSAAGRRGGEGRGRGRRLGDGARLACPCGGFASPRRRLPAATALWDGGAQSRTSCIDSSLRRTAAAAAAAARAWTRWWWMPRAPMPTSSPTISRVAERHRGCWSTSALTSARRRPKPSPPSCFGAA